MPASNPPVANGRSSFARAGESYVASIFTGVWCCVCTNHVEQHAPARISAVSRATATGASAPPYRFGALTPSSPDRFTAAMWLAGTSPWSTRSAFGTRRSHASRCARVTRGCGLDGTGGREVMGGILAAGLRGAAVRGVCRWSRAGRHRHGIRTVQGDGSGF